MFKTLTSLISFPNLNFSWLFSNFFKQTTTISILLLTIIILVSYPYWEFIKYMQSSNTWPALSIVTKKPHMTEDTEISLILLGWIRVSENILRNELNFLFFFSEKKKKASKSDKLRSVFTNCTEESIYLPDKTVFLNVCFHYSHLLVSFSREERWNSCI